MGPTYRERLKGQVACGECGKMLAVGFLSSNLMTQHGRAAGRRRQWSTPAAGVRPQIYRMSFPEKGGPRNCPVAGCPGRVETSTAMRVHLLHRNVLDTVVILEEGNPPHPRCARCDMLVPRRSLKGRHLATEHCARGAERKRRRISEAETRESLDQAFEAYGEPIKNFRQFDTWGGF